MATSGTTTFTLDIAELAEEAFERAGSELRTGYDLRTARRSLNLMMLEWANRGLNLWQVEQGTTALSDGTATYSMPSGTVDFIEHVIRKGTGSDQVDYNLTRISVSTYANRTNKNLEGRPTEIYIQRTTSPQFTLWPVPDSDDYTLVYWRLKRIEDAGTPASNTMDAPERFLPALVAGLAYYIAMKKPGLEQRVPFLKGVYDEQFDLASQEDRDRSDFRIIPYVGR